MDNHPEIEMLLSPYRVLDLTDERGHLCGKIMGDLGADVIKVESPGGDISRNIGPFYHDTPHPEKSLFWSAYNTSKRGITINLETSEGQDILRQLAKGADCLVESFSPGYMEELGLGWPQMNRTNPRIIFTSIKPFGQNGPYRDYKICDLTAQALSGMMDACGDLQGTPLMYGGPESRQSYLQAGNQAAAGTMIALYTRWNSGKGQQVNVSIAETVAWASAAPWLLLEWELVGRIAKREGNRNFRGFVYMRVCFPCKDGYVSTRVFVGGQGHFTRRLVDWMDSEGMAEDMAKVNWSQIDLLKVTQDELEHWEEVMSAFFMTHTRNELQQEAVKRQFLLFPVNEPKDLLENPQLAYKRFWAHLNFPGSDVPLPFPGESYKSTICRPKVIRRAPLIGEHNQEIYCGELGFEKKDLVLLKQAGII